MPRVRTLVSLDKNGCRPDVPSQDVLEAINERYDINPLKGLVYSRKTGNKVGRKHLKRIRVSFVHKARKHYFYRSHLIWWEQYGEWPPGPVYHYDDVHTNDQIENLYIKQLTRRKR